MKNGCTYGQSSVVVYNRLEELGWVPYIGNVLGLEVVEYPPQCRNLQNS